ncbi:hypothetical protein MIMGU_mgv1a016496mg [Erythranthe guttata]|uniref:Uncharacterized protein n=1 Tax=Erythranthe guttata TaxID=4155 RepID=A0A022QXX2_ERYGU|nr:hypothetical protein MIMGU_mgv1a016496mg [Erythranthe guttata]
MLKSLRPKHASSHRGRRRRLRRGGGGGAVDEIKNLVQRVESLCEFHHLSPQHRVCSLNTHTVLCGDVYADRNLIILFAHARNLGRQIVQMLLFSDPRSPRRFPVGFHPLSLPLIGHRPE